MFIYNKIGKSKNITYYLGQNNASSKDMFVIADLHKVKKDEFEQVVAWITKKSKEIVWKEDYESIIDKNMVRNFVVQNL